MKILFVTSASPGYPNAGAVIQTHHFIRLLAKKHQVGLWSFSNGESGRDLGSLKRCLSFVHFEERILNLSPIDRIRRRAGWIFGRNAMGRWGYTEKSMKNSLERAIREFQPDVVQFEQLHVAYPIFPLSLQPKRPVLVFNAHDAIHVVLQRSLKEQIKENYPFNLRTILDRWFCRAVKKMELDVVKTSDVLFTVSEVDAKALANSDKDFHVLANGVDTDHFQPLPWDKVADAPTMVFVGNLSYGPNTEAIHYYVENLHEKLMAKYQNLKFIIIGGVPEELEKYKKIKGMEFVGFQREFREFFAKSHMSIVPLLSGSGTRFKILDSWAMGRPVVSTTIGAEGLQYKNDENILIADEPDDFVKCVSQVLENRDQAKRISLAGRATVEKGYSWNYIVDKLEGHLLETVERLSK